MLNWCVSYLSPAKVDVSLKMEPLGPDCPSVISKGSTIAGLVHQCLERLLSLDQGGYRVSHCHGTALCGFDETQLGLNSMFIWVHYLGITAPCCQAPAPTVVSSPGMEQAASIYSLLGLCPCYKPTLPQTCLSHLCWAPRDSTLLGQM